MNSFENLNVTFRRPRPRTQSESPTIIDSDNVIPNTLECTTNSMPDMSEDEDEDKVMLLREEIKNLVKQLESAHKEIELLSVENSTLKLENDNLIKKNNVYKKVATNSPNKSRQNTPRKKNHNNCKTKQTQTDNLERKSDCITTNTENQLNTTKKEQGTQTHNMINRPDVKENKNCIETKSKTQTEIHHPQELKTNKLCILSANKQNRVLSTVEDICEKQFNFCHYLTTDGDTSDLLQGIHTKLKGYTMSDYCVILIGEQDFKIAKNYYELVLDIRKTLSEISYTNIIICLPTYKYNMNSNMYNWRVMNFNHTLCQDIWTHEYAYVLDSNAYVDYDYNTFFRQSGQLNNFGFQSIFVNLLALINDIQCINIYNNNTVDTPLITLTSHNPTHVIETEKQFFRY